MNDARPPADGSLPWTRVNELCDRYESAWKGGQRPRIEDYLGGTPEPDLPVVLRALVALELELRRERGESPTLAEYRPRFPNHAGLVGEVFAEATHPSPTLLTTTPPDAPLPPTRNGTKPPEQFGRYQILRQLGGGGMGAVYLAHDRTLDRQVALKVPFFTAADGQGVFERFLREARAAAMIHHPNLCPIHDVGQIEGIHYLTMAHIEGRPLSEILKAGPPEPRKSAALVRTLALALAEAHRAGVIHRDLKPSNIIITRRGVPVIIDFGLARRIYKGDPRLTQSGMMLGTPAYMPPEQLQGQVAAMGPGCDIYSLGVILYELLAGRRPFLGSVAEIMGQTLYATPQPPSVHGGGLDARLDTICLTAMARDAANRYPAISDLAAALDEYLRDTKKPDIPLTPSLPGPAPPAVDDGSVSTAAPGRRRLVPLVVLAITLCLVLALAGSHIWARFSPVLAWLESTPQPVLDPAPAPPSAAAAAPRSEPSATAPAARQTPPRFEPPAAVPTSQPPAPSFEPPAVVVETLPPAPARPQAPSPSSGPDDLEAVIARLTEQIRLEPQEASRWNARGNAYCRRGDDLGKTGQVEQAAADYNHAIADYNQAVRLAPNAGDLYFNRGNALVGKGDYPGAVADFGQAIRLNPSAPDYYRNRGAACIELARFDDAIRDFDEAIRLRPDDPVPYDGRGSAYAHKGDIERSKAEYERADALRLRQGPAVPKP